MDVGWRRRELSTILDDLTERHEHVVITRAGRPAAVMTQLEAPDNPADRLDWEHVKRELRAKRPLA